MLLIAPIGLFISLCTAQSSSPILIQPQDSEVTNLYISLLDRDINEALKSFDPVTGLLKVRIPENVSPPESSIESLSISEKKKIAEDPKYIWSYQESRGTAALAGAMGYAYSIESSRYYKDPTILSYIRAIFKTFGDHQTQEGEFVFSPIHYSTVWGTHEMAWRLEPLICAYEVMHSDFTPGERKAFRVVLDGGIEFLYTHENSSLSNRGVVWCGVMALCTRFTGNPKYLKAADRVFEWVGRLFHESGEIREGPGPDLVYSTVSLQYLFLYRIMSGYESLDAILLRSMKWYTRLFTSNGIPLEGMSTRQWVMDGSILGRALGPLSFYSDHDPFLAQITTRYLEALRELPGGFTLDHGGGHFLRGTQYHKRPNKIKAIPYEPYAQLVVSDHSLYYLVGKNYQTAVTLRGRKPLKGLQTWSYKGQPPLIFPSRKIQSRAIGTGFNSSLMDTSWDTFSPQYRVSSLAQEIDVLVVSQGDLITAYLFSKDTTVVIYHWNGGEMTVDWSAVKPVCAEVDRITGREMTFNDSRARILLNDAVPSLIRNERSSQYRFHFTGEYAWFAFTGPESSAIVHPLEQGIVSILVKESGAESHIALNLSAKPFVSKEDWLQRPLPILSLSAYEAKLWKP